MTDLKKENLEESPNKESISSGFGVRHTIAILGFFATLITYSMRTCLSVTIVEMAGNSSTRIISTNSSESSEELRRSSYQSEENVPEFEWDDKTRGLILGGFYYGYVMTYILGGRLIDYWGGRYPFGISCFLASLLTMFSPYVARQSSVLLIFLRILHGIIEGFGYVSVYKIISQWYPVQERSKYTSYIFSGSSFGVVISMGISGWLCTTNFLGGWPSVFYIFGSLGIVCSILWFAFVYEDPCKHPRITKEERMYITEGLPEARDRFPVPWRSLLTSRYVWITVAANFGINWAVFFVLLGLPTYFDDVHHIGIKDNGIFSAIPFLGSSLVAVSFGYFTTILSSRRVISILSIRRIAIFLSGYIPVAGFLILTFLDIKHWHLIIILFVILASFFGAAVGSFYCSPADIAPRFTGTITGITNTFGNTPGFLAPALTGLLLHYYDTNTAWKISFFVSAILTGIPTTIYFLFITTEIQPWNNLDLNEETEQGKYRSKETEQVQYHSKETEEGQYLSMETIKGQYCSKEKEQYQQCSKESEKGQYHLKDTEQSQYYSKKSEQGQCHLKEKEQDQYCSKESEKCQCPLKETEQGQCHLKEKEQDQYCSKESEKCQCPLKETEQNQYRSKETEQGQYCSNEKEQGQYETKQSQNRFKSYYDIKNVISQGQYYSKNDVM